MIPTLAARADRLQQTIRAYQRTTPGLHLVIVHEPPTCGAGWAEGAAGFDADYLHFGADDLEPHDGWWTPLVSACDRGLIGCPAVLLPDGTLQSLGAYGWDLNTQPLPDGAPVDWTTVPFMSPAQWRLVEPMPPALHYCTDAWVSARLARRGTRTVARPASMFTHYEHAAGRGAGMDIHERNRHDRALFTRLLEETP